MFYNEAVVKSCLCQWERTIEMKKGKRTPFKEKPLRQPGQSLDEEIQLLHDKMDDVLFFPSALVFLSLIEWGRWYFKVAASLGTAVLFSLFALAGSIWMAVRIRKLRQIRQHLALGRDGERVVGQYLEELRIKGFRVLHDIEVEGFNIDHVVIAPKGIFTIETKTVSKPFRGETVISFDGETTLINGRKPDRNPVVQARAQASWIMEFLKSSLGRTFPVRPVVVYPGWFVKGTPACSDVWVLNEKALPAFIENEKTELSSDDLRAVTFQISQYIRTQ
jgi:hypothetical protein